MSRHLTTFRSTVLVTLLAATGAIGIAQTAAAPQVAPTAPTAPTAAAASPAPSQAAGPANRAHRADHHARMAEHHQQRLEQLKSRLQLTPEQEPAWRAYVARTGPGSYAADQAHGAGRADKAERPRHPDLASLTTPERIEQMKAWQAERDAARQQRMDATLSFYRALDPKQQQVFDQTTASGFMRAGMKAGGHGGKHRHGHHGDHGHQGHQHPAAPKS